jgi:hypothetical protein
MMTRRTDSFVLTLLMAVALMAGCGKGSLLPQLGEDGRGLPQALVLADSLMNSRPDSALAVLEGAEGDMAGEPKSVRMRYQLLRHQAMNKAFVPFTSDSLMLDVADYYDRHGTANDRMLAHYLLGCVYRDLGEAPKAMECYQDAVSLVDTLSSNCDYRIVRGLYGEMANLYHEQNLPQDELLARQYYIDCNWKMKDTLGYINGIGQLIKPYYFMGEEDSVLEISKRVYRLYMQKGEKSRAARILPTAIYIHICRQNFQEARKLIDLYETTSGLFKENGEISNGREHYYCTKGIYYAKTHQLDSAECLFRKAQSFGYYSDAYRGLLSIYRERNNTDSVMKYSILFEDGLDSMNCKIEAEAIHKMSSLYNYSRNQKIASEKAKEAQTFRLISLYGLLVLTLLVAYVIYARKRKAAEARRLRANLIAAITEKETISEELNQLKSKELEKLIAQKEQTEKELLETISELEKKTMKPKVSDNLQGFMDCQIATLFVKKSENRAERLVPNKAEWKLLVSQFSKYMPNSYEAFLNGKLSSLELYVCILIISGFSESSIIKMVDGKPQTVTNAKARANKKLFNVPSAASLNAHLKHLALFDVI